MPVTVVVPFTWGLRVLKRVFWHAPKMGDQGGAVTPRTMNRKDAMKTDSELKKDVLAELEWDPEINAASIGVGVKDGVVTVSGHLDTYAEKFAIERALRRVVGVQAIAMEVDVTLSPQHRRSDSEIAAAAADALKWQARLPSERLRVTVEHGWVHLSGEVDWEFQRRAAEKALRPLTGVVGVSNEIMLAAKAAPGDLSSRIEQALQRQALREARRIEVAVDGTKVTLRGQVHSWQERDAAQGAVWAAPGVRTVINELNVAG
jgi:osmotically-inducible protein OsmY